MFQALDHLKVTDHLRSVSSKPLKLDLVEINSAVRMYILNVIVLFQNVYQLLQLAEIILVRCALY